MQNSFQFMTAPIPLVQFDSGCNVALLNDSAVSFDQRLCQGLSLKEIYPELNSDSVLVWLTNSANCLDLQLTLPDSSSLTARLWCESDGIFFLTFDLFQASCREKLLAKAAEQAWESICITDADLEQPGPRLVYANGGYETLMGWTEAEVLGKTPRIHQGPLTDPKVLARLKQNLSNGEHFHGETINYRKNGEAFWLEWKISPVKDSQGKITHFIAFQRDVTEIKIAQQRVRDFHSILAHELRAPLTSILGSLSLIETFHKSESDEANELLGIAAMSTERLIALINELLDLGKIESGNADLKIDTVAVKDLMDIAAKSLINYRSDDNVLIKLNDSSELVLADKDRIIQVLINLISNALKYSPADSKVTVTAQHKNDGLITFEVRDNGPGISEDNQQKLFTKFQQLASPDGIQRQGTGLGLSTAKAIVEQHQGRIGVESEVGKGSCFWFELPSVSRCLDTKSR